MDLQTACKNALVRGHSLLCNTIHNGSDPLKGYGTVIYNNWIEVLMQENEKNLTAIECLWPHIFIHHEFKFIIQQFLKMCINIVPNTELGV